MKKQDEPRRFESVTLGLPPLEMILVHTDEERGNNAGKTSVPRKTPKELDHLKAVIKLISHLKEEK
jgi:hypothetical protein